MSRGPDTLASPETSPPPSPCQLSNRNVPVNSPVWSSADRGNDMLPPDPSKIGVSIVATVRGKARGEEFVRTEEPAGTGVFSAPDGEYRQDHADNHPHDEPQHHRPAPWPGMVLFPWLPDLLIGTETGGIYPRFSLRGRMGLGAGGGGGGGAA